MTGPRVILRASTCLLLLITGCRDAARTPQFTSDSPEQVVGAPLDESTLSFTLYAPSESSVGEPVPLLLVVRNTSEQPVRLETGDSATTFDVRVLDRSGAVVWNRMNNRESLLLLREVTLVPGEELRFSDTWNQRSNDRVRVPAGIFEIQGTLNVQGARDLRTASRRLSIPVHR